MSYRDLPKPDEHGNYWFGRRAMPSTKLTDPVIFHSRLIRQNGVGGGYIVLLNGQAGFLWEGNELARFATPRDAIAALNNELSLKGLR